MEFFFQTVCPFWQSLMRRKRNEEVQSRLARVLTLFDLTSLGVGSTLGIGIYVLAGQVARSLAGPAVTVSFVIAAIASGFAGICYAEFAARVPRAGSAYVYSYVTIGEFVAFTIGWNLILEYVIGVSSVARAMSGCLDTLTGNIMSNALKSWMPMKVGFLASYPDFFAFFVVLLVTVLLAIGVKESSRLNNVCTSVNMMTIGIVIVAGAIKCDPRNWSLPENDGDQGGFMPFGVAGVMQGAAQCFFAFVGFDCVATCGEEAINPQRNIPLSIALSLGIVFLSYFGISTVLTLMVPYYDLNPTAPLVDVFDNLGWTAIKWIVTIGSMFALCTALLGAIFPLPRILYSMSTDGLLFRKLGVIHARTQTPLLATALAGLFSAFMALLFDLNQLINMMSIGTLMAYTIVAICVLVLRYRADEYFVESGTPRCREILWHIFNLRMTKHITELTSNIAVFGMIAFSITSILFCVLLNRVQVAGSSVGSIVGLVFVGVTLIVLMVMIACQPTLEGVLTFKVPFVPWIPCISVLFNVYLMFQLDAHTWIRFGVWMIIGYLIYFFYGHQHSIEGAQQRCDRESLMRIRSLSYGSISCHGSGSDYTGQSEENSN